MIFFPATGKIPEKIPAVPKKRPVLGDHIFIYHDFYIYMYLNIMHCANSYVLYTSQVTVQVITLHTRHRSDSQKAKT